MTKPPEKESGNAYGEKVASTSPLPAPPMKRERPPVTLDPTKLVGPTLKIARAKRHLGDFEASIKDFFASKPYDLLSETDPQTGEIVFRIRVYKTLPDDLSTIAGDVIHNLRSALDQMVCALVRANRKQVSGGNGFPIMGSAKRFEEACIGKLKNTPIKADRFIRRLKPYQGGNKALWLLSELDNMDKHNAIVPVVVGQAQTRMQVGMPGIFLTPDGSLAIGGGPPGSQPFGFHLGFTTPNDAKPVELVHDNCELYRMKPQMALFPYNIEATAQVTFGKTQITNHEPIVETLQSLIQLVERIAYIVETRIL
jgi:hypothetical protein